jgi:hypothetical protein
MIVQMFGSGVRTLSRSSHVRAAICVMHYEFLTCIVALDDFFVGIGDINSAFLPKIEPLAPAVSSPSPGELYPVLFICLC